MIIQSYITTNGSIDDLIIHVFYINQTGLFATLFKQYKTTTLPLYHLTIYL